MSTTPDLDKAHEASLAAQEAANDIIESTLEVHEKALKTRRGALESMISSYDSSVHSLSVIQQSPDFTEHHQKREKAYLVVLQAECLILAQELDGPDQEYTHRLREITQRRKELLGY